MKLQAIACGVAAVLLATACGGGTRTDVDSLPILIEVADTSVDDLGAAWCVGYVSGASRQKLHDETIAQNDGFTIFQGVPAQLIPADVYESLVASCVTSRLFEDDVSEFVATDPPSGGGGPTVPK